MKEDKNLDEIVLDNNLIVKVNGFNDYGNDPKYFAIVGDDLYHKFGNFDCYRLLKKDFRGNNDKQYKLGF